MKFPLVLLLAFVLLGALLRAELDPLLSLMTLEEKVGQLIVVQFQGEKVNDEAKTLVQDVRVGGIIYYEWANGLKSPEHVQNLSNGLQQLAQDNPLAIPLFIAIDQEGGRVTRLKSGFTVFPGNAVMGAFNDPGLAAQCAYVMGKEMRAVGINVNFAPVVDVHSNPQNPVMGSRVYSGCPQSVATLAQGAIKGYREAGIVSCLKHFPGHGDASCDSHLDLPVVAKSKKEMMGIELYPYRYLLKEADMVMTGHLSVPSLDRYLCATFSPAILQHLLREELGYQGVIISDSLVMKGVLLQCPDINSVAIQAFNAGCDIVLLGGRQLMSGSTQFELTGEDVIKVHQSLVEAVKTGVISEKRLDASVARILKLKRAKNLFSFYFPFSDAIERDVNTEESQKLANLLKEVDLP
ncbi:MAG TPA: beta-N-acetylhexosaminidase [Rhabdochlamydiaceae bacterium]|jgi:beta-N-acetylhexosaminidase